MCNENNFTQQSECLWFEETRCELACRKENMSYQDIICVQKAEEWAKSENCGEVSAGSSEAALTLARAPVGGIPIVAGDAGLTVPARGQVLTLLTDALVHTLAVPVALTGCEKQENYQYWYSNKAPRDPQESALGRAQMKPFQPPSQEVLISCQQYTVPKTGVYKKNEI